MQPDLMKIWGQFDVWQFEFNCRNKIFVFERNLDPNVRMLTDSLPFTSEGYNQGKDTSFGKLGRPSEIVNNHFKEIMQLPTINGTNPQKIYEFMRI